MQLTGITSVFCQCWNKKKHAFATNTTIAAVEAVTWPQSRMALESRLRCFLHGLHGLLARCCLGCRLGSTAYRPGELSLVPLRGVGGDGEPQVRAPRTTKTHWSRMAILCIKMNNFTENYQTSMTLFAFLLKRMTSCGFLKVPKQLFLLNYN